MLSNIKPTLKLVIELDNLMQVMQTKSQGSQQSAADLSYKYRKRIDPPGVKSFYWVPRIALEADSDLDRVEGSWFLTCW